MNMRADILEVSLQPGQIWFGGGHARISTLLGSCVAFTLWHPEKRIGGMCHFMLPRPPLVGNSEPDLRYASDAVEALLAMACAYGSRPDEYEVKLFGGGNMFTSMQCLGPNCRGGIPERNVAIARQLASRHGLRVLAEDLGGDGHRQLVLEIWSGQVWLKHVAITVPPACPALRGPR